MKTILKLFLGFIFSVAFSVQAMDEEFEWHPSLRKVTREKILKAVKALDLDKQTELNELKRRQDNHLEILAKRKQNFANKSEEEKAQIRKRDAENKNKRLANPKKRERHNEVARKSHKKRKLENPINDEKRAKHNAAVRKNRANRTQEQKEKNNEHQRNWQANMTPEQRQKNNEYQRYYRANITPAQRKNHNEYHQNYRAKNSERIKARDEAELMQALEANFPRKKPKDANEQECSSDSNIQLD